MEHNTIECKERELWIIQPYRAPAIEKYLRAHKTKMAKALFVKSKIDTHQNIFDTHCVITRPTTAKSIIKVLTEGKEQFIAAVAAKKKPPAHEQLAVNFNLNKDSIVVRILNYTPSLAFTSLPNQLHDVLSRYYQDKPNHFFLNTYPFEDDNKRKLSDSSKEKNINPRPTKIHKKDDDKDIASATKSPTPLKTINKNNNNNNASTPIYSPTSSVPFAASQSDNEISLLLSKPTQILSFNTCTHNVNNNRNGLLIIVNEIFKHYQFDNDPGIDINKSNNFILKIQSKYKLGVPYHNTAHASSVVLNLHYLFECAPGLFTNLEKLTALQCAAAHDVGHDGFNNSWHQAMKTSRYQKYPKSTQEKYHWRITNDTLCQENSNWQFALSDADRMYVLDIIRESIIGTDQKFHPKHLQFLENNDNKTLDQIDKLKVISAFLHGADIMASCKCFEVANMWGKQIIDEFKHQGGLEVWYFQKIVSTPRKLFCSESNFCENQAGWINFIIIPYFTALNKWCPNHDLTNKLLKNARQNLRVYELQK